jgi:hypothetical protein
MIGWSAPEIKCYEGHTSEHYSSFKQLNLGVSMGARLKPWVEATLCGSTMEYSCVRPSNDKLFTVGHISEFRTDMHGFNTLD